jgi:hypothetical protein
LRLREDMVTEVTTPGKTRFNCKLQIANRKLTNV